MQPAPVLVMVISWSKRVSLIVMIANRSAEPASIRLVRRVTTPTNSRIRTCTLTLHGVREPGDVYLLSDARMSCLRNTISATEFLVASIGSGGQAIDAVFGNHYFRESILRSC